MNRCTLLVRRQRLPAGAAIASVAVKIEAVPVDIFHRELTQAPRLPLERFDDSCASRAQFFVGRVDVGGKYPVNRRFEWAVSSTKENRPDVIPRDSTDIATGV